MTATSLCERLAGKEDSRRTQEAIAVVYDTMSAPDKSGAGDRDKHEMLAIMFSVNNEIRHV